MGGEVPRICGTGVLRQDGLNFPGGSVQNLRLENASVPLSTAGPVVGAGALAVPKTRMELLSPEQQASRQVPATKMDLAQQQEQQEQAGGYAAGAVATPQAAESLGTGGSSLIDQIQAFGFSREDAEEALR